MVTPFDAPYKRPDAFSERIARNQQFLLKEESHMDKVVDPAGGSYYVETLTVNLAREKAGNYSSKPRNRADSSLLLQKARCRMPLTLPMPSAIPDVARRKEVLLGTKPVPEYQRMAADKISQDLLVVANAAVVPRKDRMHCSSMKRAASDFEAFASGY